MSSAAAVATDLDLRELDLLDLDRFAQEGPPFAEFARLTREAPVWWHAARRGSAGFWVVTGYDEIVSLGRRPAELSSDADYGGVTGLGAGDELQDSLDGLHDRVRRWSSYGLADWLGGDGSTSLASEAKQLLTMDPPEHTAFRKMVNRGFTPRMIATLRPKIERTVRATFDQLPMHEPFDLVERLAMPIPLHMIADMLGVPPEDHYLVREWSNRMVGGTDAEYRVGAISEVRAMIEFARYVQGLCERYRGSGADSIVSVLLGSRYNGQELNQVRLTIFVFLLAVAGNETTRNAISHGVWELARHPEQYRRLVDDPGLIPTAVEEILRWASPVMYLRRTALTEVRVAGCTVRPGEIVSLWFLAANRSPAHFLDPDTFDVGRTPNHHVAFGGGGPHFCLGANLARLEIEAVLRELVSRAGRVDMAGEPERLRSNFLHGIKHLPVVLRPLR
jgi:cholest-4-en-3-one 26-monooxygenase